MTENQPAESKQLFSKQSVVPEDAPDLKVADPGHVSEFRPCRYRPGHLLQHLWSRANAEAVCDRQKIGAGYPGEDGFEVTAPSAVTAMIWNDIVERSRPHGIAPCGLGARDTLRLEAGYLLYGQDVDDEHSSLEANYSWVVKFDKGDFIGKNVLLKQKKEGLRRRLTGIVLEQAGVPRPGCAVYGRDGGRLGVLCSATYSPTLAKGIGVGYMTPAELKEGEPVEVEIHSRRA